MKCILNILRCIYVKHTLGNLFKYIYLNALGNTYICQYHNNVNNKNNK